MHSEGQNSNKCSLNKKNVPRIIIKICVFSRFYEVGEVDSNRTHSEVQYT